MTDQGLEKRITGLLEIKDNYNLDNDKFLLFMGLVNLMNIINLLEVRTAGHAQGSRAGHHQEMAPFLGMFGSPKARVPADSVQK